MSLYFEQQNQETVTRRVARPQAFSGGGEGGIDGQFVNAVTSLSKWQFSAQEWQPPRPRWELRVAAIKPDASDWNSTSAPFLVPFREGWAIQPVQPPAPFSVRSSPYVLLAGATARGDDGIAATFVPPWKFAAKATTFPDYQNLAPGAIPAWNAGPPAGAVLSQPNIDRATVLKTSPGNLLTVTIIQAGTTLGGVYDLPVNQPSIATQIATLPNALGTPIVFDWPCQQGILIVPGAGQIVAAKWV